jgi:hypothetical protein
MAIALHAERVRALMESFLASVKVLVCTADARKLLQSNPIWRVRHLDILLYDEVENTSLGEVKKAWRCASSS